MTTRSTGAHPASDLLDGLPDAVLVAGADGRIRFANAAVTTLLGYDPGALRGQLLSTLMPERFRAAHDRGFARFLATGSGELIGATTRVAARTAEGVEVAVDLTLSPLTASRSRAGVEPTGGSAAADAGGGGVVVGVLRDAGPAVLLERQLEVSRHLAAILRVTAALAEAPDAETAFAELLPRLCAQLDWDAACLWLPTGSGGQLACSGSWHRPERPIPELRTRSAELILSRGEGLPGAAGDRRETVVADDLWRDPRFLRSADARADGVRSGVAFPVVRGETVLAVCELFSAEPRSVPPELLGVLTAAGRQIGEFLGRLRAEGQLRTLAETLQRSLLPARLPPVPGVDLGSLYRAGGEDVLAGGDTYDVLPLGAGRWMVLIADVCGLGAEAAAVTALTRHTARAAAAAGATPAGVLAAVNIALLQEERPGPLRFVTACCLVLEPVAGGARGRLSVAGHPLPVLQQPDGSCAGVGIAGRALGICEDIGCRDVDVRLGPGSRLVLYTDGVTEARDAAGVQFEDTGLCAALGAAAGRSAQETAEAIEAAVARHRGPGRGAGDDLAVLVLGC